MKYYNGCGFCSTIFYLASALLIVLLMIGGPIVSFAYLLTHPSFPALIVFFMTLFASASIAAWISQ